MADKPVLLTPEEVAESLRIARSRVYDLIAAGTLRSVRIGRSRRIPRESLEAYIRTLTGDAAE